jgi:hypothetical protein
MTDRLSETVSENRRRGRPRVFDAATFARLRAELQRDTPDVSDRTVQNRLYQYKAQALLNGHEWARWLIDPAGILRRTRGTYRQTILQELGRLPNDQDLVEMAQWICRQKPTAREAVRIIRALRRGYRPPGDVADLSARIIDLLNDYLRHHAGVDRDLLLEALQGVKRAVRRMKSP